MGPRLHRRCSRGCQAAAYGAAQHRRARHVRGETPECRSMSVTGERRRLRVLLPGASANCSSSPLCIYVLGINLELRYWLPSLASFNGLTLSRRFMMMFIVKLYFQVGKLESASKRSVSTRVPDSWSGALCLCKQSRHRWNIGKANLSCRASDIRISALTT